MRPIKFRAFNTSTGKMIDLYKTTHLALDANLKCDGIFIPFREEYKIMQFTGLADKNGKEIYEGDIVSWTRHKWVDLDADDGWREATDIGVVEWRWKGFWVDQEDFGWEGENLWNWDDLEVIGNIYEHPNLLPHNPELLNNL